MTKDLKIKNDTHEEKLSKSTEKRKDHFQRMLSILLKRLTLVQLKNIKIPKKRRGGEMESTEEIAHKVTWTAVKKNMQKRVTNESRRTIKNHCPYSVNVLQLIYH
ncbi:MAG: hypothetical protein H0X03_05935 [Nitrosopumilus sp.]|nr:hypothetical protein [Nitrosopumilus sp.]